MDSFFAEVNAIPITSEPEASSTLTEIISAPPQPATSSTSAPAVKQQLPSHFYPAPPPKVAPHHLPTSSAPKVAAHHLPISVAPHHLPITVSAPSSSSSSQVQPRSGGGFATSFSTTYATQQPPPPRPAEVKLRKEAAVRSGAGDVWIDPTLADWPENDYRIFVGDLSKECRDEQLGSMFTQYPSYAKARVVRAAYDGKGKGYGFVSFLDPMDCAKAIREMNGKYCGPRPMKITKSSWEDRNIKEVKKKAQKKRKMEEALGIA